MEAYHRKLLETEANPDVGVIVDAPHPGAPLVVAFGYVEWEAPNRFDFARRLRKLEQAGGRPLNLILVRDVANLWYQYGVNGLGPDVRTAAASLRDRIAALRPASVGTIGQSMGGYAAILFGALLNANRVLAFGALSYMRSDWARRDDDLRWLAVMETLDRFPPRHRYDDLPALLAASPSAPAMHLVYGTGPEEGGPPNRDDLHAARYAALPGVGVERIPEAGHAVVEWLIQRQRIDACLQHHLLDPLGDPALRWQPPTGLSAGAPVPLKPWNHGWRNWIAENLALGADEGSVMGALVGHGFHPGEARREIYKAARSPYHVPLARLLQRRKADRAAARAAAAPGCRGT
jgi:hypothetical protein